MSPLTRRDFLGTVVAIPAAVFLPRPTRLLPDRYVLSFEHLAFDADVPITHFDAMTVGEADHFFRLANPHLLSVGDIDRRLSDG